MSSSKPRFLGPRKSLPLLMSPARLAFTRPPNLRFAAGPMPTLAMPLFDPATEDVAGSPAHNRSSGVVTQLPAKANHFGPAPMSDATAATLPAHRMPRSRRERHSDGSMGTPSPSLSQTLTHLQPVRHCKSRVGQRENRAANGDATGRMRAGRDRCGASRRPAREAASVERPLNPVKQPSNSTVSLLSEIRIIYIMELRLICQRDMPEARPSVPVSVRQGVSSCPLDAIGRMKLQADDTGKPGLCLCTTGAAGRKCRPPRAGPIDPPAL